MLHVQVAMFDIKQSKYVKRKLHCLITIDAA